MAADRRIDAHRSVRLLGEQQVVEHLAHAVEALELIAGDAAGSLDHARDRERVVGGELRIKMRPRAQQFLRTDRKA